MLAFSSFASGVAAGVDDDRENVLERGPRWVSLSSIMIVSIRRFRNQWESVLWEKRANIVLLRQTRAGNRESRGSPRIDLD